jgi:hypothetical protein
MDNGRPNWLVRLEQPKLLAAVACMLVLAALGVLRLDDDKARIDVSAGHTTTTTADDGADAEPDDDGVLAVDTTTTTSIPASSTSTSSTTTSTTAATSTTSTTVCRNSTNPACGPFRWDPPPEPDQPIVVTVATSAEQAVAGQPFTFTVKATDLDAQPVFCEVYDLGDGTKKGAIGTPCEAGGPEVEPCQTNRFGPWTPPTRKGGVFEYTLTHTYTTAGTYTVKFFSYSEDGGTCHPYGSTKTTQMQLTVAAPAS